MSVQLSLGRWLGVPVALQYSVVLTSLMLLVSLRWRFQYMYPDWGSLTIWTTAGAVTLAYGLSLSARAVTHLAVARWVGSSLHSTSMVAVGDLTKSTDDVRPLPLGLMALAGIGMHLLLGVLCLGLASTEGSSPARIPSTPVMAVLVWSGYVNLCLSALNLLPGHPLDGGRIVQAWFAWVTGRSDRALRLAAGGGQTIGVLLMLLGGFRLLTNAPFDAAWLLVLGWFIFEAAQDSAAPAGAAGRSRAA